MIEPNADRDDFAAPSAVEAVSTPESWWRRNRSYVGGAFVLLLFIGAIFLLRWILRQFKMEDLMRELHNLPLHCIIGSIVCTFISYLGSTGYDLLALRMSGHTTLSTPRIMAISFTAYAFSNNLGLSVVSGASVRYRFYTALGMGRGAVAQILAFCTVQFTLGVITAAGLIFAIFPMPLPVEMRNAIPEFITERLVGVIMLIPAIVYLWWTRQFGNCTRHIGSWSVDLPSTKVGLAHLFCGCVTWVMAGVALWFLMPEGMTLSQVVSVFMIAEVVAQISHVPGGLGTFEYVVLGMTSHTLSPEAVVIAVLVFRAVYYLLPFVLALVIFIANEIDIARRNFRRDC